jgi:hypothetical protein
MSVGIFTSSIAFKCSKLWEQIDECGTFLEIHRPLDTAILEKIKITRLDPY